MSRRLTVHTHSVDYPIIFEKGGLDRIGMLIGERLPAVKKVLIVSDETVTGLYMGRAVTALREAGLDVSTCAVPAGEASKSQKFLFHLYDVLHQSGITRTDLLVALGGGVVGDLTGYAAASWLRGCSWVQIPTTLLAMTDSSVGGKTGIDLPFGKNLVGAFWHPSLVVADTELLSTLAPVEWAQGMAEVIKYGCIRDADLLRDLEEGRADMDQVICRCVEIKRDIVEADEFDRGERMLLNFGHTIGHAIEKAGHYTIQHGSAVAIGMVAATILGEKLGVTPVGLSQRIARILIKNGLPTFTTFTGEELAASMLKDKKNLGGAVHFILLKDIGEAVIHPIAPTELSGLLDDVLRQAEAISPVGGVSEQRTDTV